MPRCARRCRYKLRYWIFLLSIVCVLMKIWIAVPSTGKLLQAEPAKLQQTESGNVVDENRLFSFIPPGLKNCNDLYKNGTGAKLDFSKDYYIYKKKFEQTLDRVLRNGTKRRGVEGNSGSMREESLTYSLLSSADFVQTICETGFNAGHSAFTFLSANPNSHVYSFDLGVHHYARPMAEFLNKTFGGRLTVNWGPSDKTVPAFIKANPDVKCDIVVVDGGHGYRSCKADLRNLRGLARKSYHLLIIDDYPTRVLPEVKKAWEEELFTYQLQEHFKCQFYSRKSRGFTVGKYINL